VLFKPSLRGYSFVALIVALLVAEIGILIALAANGRRQPPSTSGRV
jgi:hypothetical protein